MNNIVVYTCITGGYDNLIEPSCHPDYVDWVCFTEQDMQSNIWKIHNISEVFSIDDNVRLNRFFKWNPHFFFKDYDYSIYIDPNMDIKSIKFFDRIKILINANVLMSMAEHPGSSSLYDEAKTCIEMKKDSPENINNFLSRIKDDFIDEPPLWLNNMIFRAHNDKIIKKINTDVWYFIQNYTYRDQLVFPYIRQKYKMPIVDFNGGLKFPTGVLGIYGTLWYAQHGNFEKNEIEYELYEFLYSLLFKKNN